MRKICLSILSFLALTSSYGCFAATKILVTGDSITRMTGNTCPGLNYSQCNSVGMVPFENSYSSMIPGLSNYEYVVVYNSGRGGDTCLTNAAWTEGAFSGLSRGLYSRTVSTITSQAEAAGATDVLVLIGINDVNGMPGVPATTAAQTIACIKNVWTAIRANGYQVRALTYPPISTTNAPWGALGAAKTAYLNCSIRNAIVEFNNAVGNSNPVMLVDLEQSWSPLVANTYLLPDGIHPNPEGARRMALRWYTGSTPPSVTSCGSEPL